MWLCPSFGGFAPPRFIGIWVYNELRLFYRNPILRKACTDHPGALDPIIAREIEREKTG